MVYLFPLCARGSQRLIVHAAKERAAYAALVWMANQGYDVAYALGEVLSPFIETTLTSNAHSL